jgi:hypothetical protein
MSDSPQLPAVSLMDHDPAWAAEGARLAGIGAKLVDSARQPVTAAETV